jgi:hypothetical protein
MKFLILLQIAIFTCVFSSCQAQIFIDSKFNTIVEDYMEDNHAIENNCSAQTNFGIHFVKIKCDTIITIMSFVGQPPGIIPIDSDSTQLNNPRVIKGAGLVDDRLVVVYDYSNSNGYGLYDTSKVDKGMLSEFKSVPDSCVNVTYPGSIVYKLCGDSIVFKEQLDSFKLK